jgi:hypothetical protein
MRSVAHEGMNVPSLPAGTHESKTPNYPSQSMNAPKGNHEGTVDTSPQQALPKPV